MKKVFLILGLILLLLGCTFYAHRAHTVNYMKEKQDKVENAWVKVLKNSDYRINLLQQLTYPTSLISKFADSNNLKMNILDTNNNLDFQECTLAFNEKEYLLNKFYLNLLTHLKNDTLLNNSKNQKIFIALKKNDTLSNAIINEYNAWVLDYNKYISLFPNFVFAKQKGFRMKKYFDIKYGVQNEDPNIRATEIPEWMKNIDTL